MIEEKRKTTTPTRNVALSPIRPELRNLHTPSRPKRTAALKIRQKTRTSPPARRSAAPDALNFVTQGLETWWKDYLMCLDRFLHSASGKNVHDIRVAIRRLNTAFDLIDRFNPDNMVRRARGKLKDQLSALSSLRDAHVEMVRMRGFLKEIPEMKPFYDELIRKESQQLKAVRKISWKQDRKFIEISYNRAMLRLNARRASSSGESTRRIIEATMDVLFDNLSKKLEKVTPSDVASIHRVRLAFRPLRYTLEIVQPLLGLDLKQLRVAALLAKVMGRIQDLDVLMKDLVESNWRKERALAAVIEVWLSLERQKAEAVQRFFKQIPKFGTIWKTIIHEQARVAPPRSQTLYVLRHGIAVNRGDPAYPLDSDRPLTDKGIKRMRRIADGMRRIRVEFDLILSSPYRRALETAFVVAQKCEVGESVQTIQALKAEVVPEEVIRTLLDRFSMCERLLLVGHEPQLSALVSTLTSGSAGARPLLKKGGLCKLEVDGLQVGKCATLVWLLTPRQLMSMA
jgi:phosphohistidine phosphatase